jgi:hypothetical protein
MAKFSIRLQSDFNDFYDHCFASSHEKAAFQHNRFSRTSRTRRDDFAILKQMGVQTVQHGTPAQILDYLIAEHPGITRDMLCQISQVVVYTEDTSHRGEGKLLVPMTTALEEYPYAFCSLYMPTYADWRHHGAYSFRYVRAGLRQFWVKQVSLSDWRSNCGEGFSEVLTEAERADAYGLVPLYAIDFVSIGRELLAVDYNDAPGLKGGGLDFYLTPSDVYKEIEGFYRQFLP